MEAYHGGVWLSWSDEVDLKFRFGGLYACLNSLGYISEDLLACLWPSLLGMFLGVKIMLQIPILKMPCGLGSILLFWKSLLPFSFYCCLFSFWCSRPFACILVCLFFLSLGFSPSAKKKKILLQERVRALLYIFLYLLMIYFISIKRNYKKLWNKIKKVTWNTELWQFWKRLIRVVVIFFKLLYWWMILISLINAQFTFLIEHLQITSKLSNPESLIARQ